MRVLVLGAGGREHALAHTFHRQGHHPFCFPGNPGTEQICEPIRERLSLSDHQGLIDFVKGKAIDLTVAGPEAILVDGMGDAFIDAGLPFFGPKKKESIIEGSKMWAKQFMHRHNIPTARYVICQGIEEALGKIHRLFGKWGGVVIKPNGLTAGKGVVVCRTPEEAVEAINLLKDNKTNDDAAGVVILEEVLHGTEVSLLVFSDGKDMKPMISSQDHKALFNDDQGPNTGGLGAYAPTPFLSDDLAREIEEEIITRTNLALQAEGMDYRGVLYFGLMLTENGPKVLEYNCRFGDPETQAILPLLETDLATVMLACVQQRLKQIQLQWSSKSACCVVMASGGYPAKFQTGYRIQGLERLTQDPNVIIFHAGTTKEDGLVATSGGRVLGVTGLGNHLEVAVQRAYNTIHKIHYPDAHYRTDIAYQASLFGV